MSIFTKLYTNVGSLSKFLIAIVSDVQVNMHTGWTNPTGIVTDILAFAVWLVPNVTTSKTAETAVTDIDAVATAVVKKLGSNAVQKTG